jgi:2-polyprenyl-6-methoxyphenol hydroxylase-like FAD-dependent oxidoreductase
LARLTIVGAGPAGLVAAIAARRLGWEVAVFEREPDFGRVGGGVAIQPNGLQVLDAIGVLDSFRPAMNHLWVGTVESPPGRVLMRSDFREVDVPHAGFAVVLRHTLQEHLLAAAVNAGADIRFGHRCTGYTRRSADEGVVHFDGRPDHECGIVIACDGTHSPMRAAVRAPARVVEIGEAYLRAVAGREIPGDGVMAELWGDDGRRFGMVPLPGGQTYVFCRVPLGGWDDIRQNRLGEWLESWRDFGDRVTALMAAVPDWNDAVYDELKEVRLDRWYDPPVFIAGDAAHAMTPNLGQGANSAMVDALVLIRVLDDGVRAGVTLEAMGRRYDGVRRPFATKLQKAARQGGALADWRSPVARAVRDTLLRGIGRVAPFRRRALLMASGYNPPERRYIESA